MASFVGSLENLFIEDITQDQQALHMYQGLRHA